MLERTLRAFQTIRIPEGLQVELIIVDNGSTDQTAAVVHASHHSRFETIYCFEPKPGKSKAQNTALSVARGEVLLFTDDDVEPAENWIEEMSAPLLEGRCEAVTGKIILAESLRRPWFTPMHKVWLAYIDELPDSLPELVGASMGIRRSVFDTIAGFDENLGPGASGFGEETLLWMQMKEAGMKVLPVRDTHVVHYPEASRLLRACWLAAASRFGHTGAYVMHHWNHSRERFPALQLLWVNAKLALRSSLRRIPNASDEGCAAWEMSYLVRRETLKHFMRESRKPRHYDLRGMRKFNCEEELEQKPSRIR
jgi:glucosyl-dolichyl phosphate glucuronosyltransferase